MLGNLRVTSAPAELPLTLDEVKAFLRVEDTAADALIMALFRGVVAQLDGPWGQLNRCLITQTLTGTLDEFPVHRFDIPLPPFQSVSSIQYVDTDGNTQTLSSAVYRVLNANNPNVRGRVELAYGQSWPSTRSIAQAVTVTWIAGYGARNAVPENIRDVIMTMVKARYDNRDPMTEARLYETPAFAGLFDQARFPGLG